MKSRNSNTEKVKVVVSIPGKSPACTLDPCYLSLHGTPSHRAPSAIQTQRWKTKAGVSITVSFYPRFTF